eukprot:8458923-Alexandrium_andersonii.AAC.1
MSASLVGSEMCIRDSAPPPRLRSLARRAPWHGRPQCAAAVPLQGVRQGLLRLVGLIVGGLVLEQPPLGLGFRPSLAGH